MKNNLSRATVHVKHRCESAFVLVFCAFLMVMLLGVAAFIIDYGRALYERHRVSIAVDAAALSALHVLGPTATFAAVESEVGTMAVLNGVSVNEVTVIQCGQWSEGTFLPQSAGICDASTNAVRVVGARAVPVLLGKVLGVQSLLPEAEALAYAAASGASCIRPFGVEASYFDSLHAPTGLSPGDSFLVSGTQSSGNWGKIDIGGNMSSGSNFLQAMLNDVCNNSVQVGAQIGPATGGASIQDAFQAILGDQTPPFAHQGMIVALTSDFPNGASSTITIQEFIRLNLDWHNNRNGNQWEARFTLVERNVTPPSGSGGGGAGARVLVQ